MFILRAGLGHQVLQKSQHIKTRNKAYVEESSELDLPIEHGYEVVSERVRCDLIDVMRHQVAHYADCGIVNCVNIENLSHLTSCRRRGFSPLCPRHVNPGNSVRIIELRKAKPSRWALLLLGFR
jgi:hypothetical protein